MTTQEAAGRFLQALLLAPAAAAERASDSERARQNIRQKGACDEESEEGKVRCRGFCRI
jgi:hypothetical protein